jgi:hypothetical protein
VHPLNWALTQYKLGLALAMIGDREAGTGRLAEAVVAFCGALEYAPRLEPKWGQIAATLGRTRTAIAARSPGAAELEEAVRVLSEALNELERAGEEVWVGRGRSCLADANTLLVERRTGTGGPGEF